MLHRDNDAREWIRNQCIVCTHRNTQPIVIRQSRLDLRLGWLRSMQIDQERESNLESNLSLVKRESRWSKAINGWRGCFTVIWGRKTKPSKPYSCETMLLPSLLVSVRSNAQSQSDARQDGWRSVLAFLFIDMRSTNPNSSIRARCVRAYERLIARYNFPRYERACIPFFLTHSREHYRLQSYSSLQYK